MASEIVPLTCALRFKPPTLVLLYKDLQTGKNRRRSMPLRKLTAETSLPSYITQLLHSSNHAAYIAKIPPNQLESLLQRVRDAQIRIKQGLHTMPSQTTPSHVTSSHTSPLHTSLVDAPPLNLTAKLPREGGGGGSVQNEQFESALAELLGDGSDGDDSGGPSANGTVQSSFMRGTNIHSDTDGKLEQVKVPNADDQSKPQIPDPPKSSPDLTGLPSTTNSLYGRRLPPLGPAGAGRTGHGEFSTTREAVVRERNSTGLRTGNGVLSSVVMTKPSSEKSGGVEVPSSSRGRESQQQSKCRKPSPGTFPTEVPDYSADFSSDSEALPSPRRPAEGGEQSPWQPTGGGGKSPLAEDTSLSFGIDHHLCTSGSSLHIGDLSADQDFDLSSSGSLGLRNFSPSGIVTGDNSHASENEDLNKASDKHLGKRKAQMDVLFEANRLHPGDKGYVYDKEVEFGRPQIESGWDSDSSCSDF